MSQSKIYVGNLSYDTTEDDLHAAFGNFGEISDLRLIMDRETGRSKGFAFVSFEDQVAAEKAINEMNGKELGGRTVKVNVAKEDRGSGGGRRSGNGGGFRR